MIGDFLVDGVDVSADIVNGEYTFENIAANHNVNVIFVENVYYTVTATSGEHGTITPEGETQVVNGGSISFEVVPDEGYYVASFTVDGNDAMSGLVNGVSSTSTIRSYILLLPRLAILRLGRFMFRRMLLLPKPKYCRSGRKVW